MAMHLITRRTIVIELYVEAPNESTADLQFDRLVERIEKIVPHELMRSVRLEGQTRNGGNCKILERLIYWRHGRVR